MPMVITKLLMRHMDCASIIVIELVNIISSERFV